MSAAQTAMNTLAAQWYLAVTKGCKLATDQFQLMQGAMPVGATSENLWNIFDSVPPLTATTFYNPAQLNSLSQDYGGVISALIAQGALQFQTDMQDSYAAWNNYKKTITPLPSDNLGWSKAFSSWAQANLPQSQVTKCITDFNTMLEDPIAMASNQLLNVQFAPSNMHPNDYVYTTTIEQLTLALNNATPASVTLNSSTDSSDVSHTWAQTEASGIFDIFGLGGDTSYDSLTTKITSAGVSIQAKFAKLVTLPAAPLKQPSDDNELSQYMPWFNSAALGEGHAKQDNTVWKAGDAISWASTFGPNGNMQRFASSLVIVDGISMTMTSKAALSTADQASFKAAAAGGFFPFFEAEGSGGWSHNVSFDDQGNITVSSSSPAGNPQVLGVLVSPITDLF
ncbi:hypothetical protein [Paucibacter soli]|uniref:hypothetical protein n=1 Tax=Paucibacter soli TaxID=3133433 RepID=UPI0030A2D49A